MNSSNSNPASKAVDWTGEVHLWPQKPRDINFHLKKKQYLNNRNYKASLQICNPYVSALLHVTQLWLEVSPGRFGSAYRSHLQRSSSPRLGLLEDRSNRQSWNVGDSTSNQSCVTSQKSEELAEACNDTMQSLFRRDVNLPSWVKSTQRNNVSFLFYTCHFWML